MKNVQVTIDQETLRQVDRAGKSLDLKRSEIVRQALREWLRRRAISDFEKEWIGALQNQPEVVDDADDWLSVQAWRRK